MYQQKDYFRYDKKIDEWSYSMIKDIKEIWGSKLQEELLISGKNLSARFLIEYLNGYLKKCGEPIFKKFSIILSGKYKPDCLNYYINTCQVSLHNAERKFVSISIFHPFASYPTVIIHEIFHVLFYDFYDRVAWNKIGNIPENKLNELKEVVTELINIEFKDYIDIPDRGYPEHSELRKKAARIWCKEKDFIKLLAKLSKK